MIHVVYRKRIAPRYTTYKPYIPLHMIKKITLKNKLHYYAFIAILFMAFTGYSQVGVGTTTPQAALDITSSDSGILIPRVGLTSITSPNPVTNPEGGVLVPGTMVWNTGTPSFPTTGYFYWENGQWNQVLSSNKSSVYIGRIVLTSTGTVNVNSIGFTPSTVEFVAINRAQNINDGTYRSSTNNSNDIRMAGGFTTGYATNRGGGVIEQQVISNAFSGSSINNIGTYTSNSHCLAALFVNNNGEILRDDGTNSGGATHGGLVRASLQSFNANGFTLNVDRFLSPAVAILDRTNTIVVIYKAYR